MTAGVMLLLYLVKAIYFKKRSIYTTRAILANKIGEVMIKYSIRYLLNRLSTFLVQTADNDWPLLEYLQPDMCADSNPPFHDSL